MELIFKIITCILEVFAFYNFLSSFGKPRQEGKLWIFSWCAGLGVSIFAINMLNLPFVNLAVTFCFMIIIGKIMFQLSWRKTAYYVIIIFVTLFLGEFIVVMLIQTSYYYNLIKSDYNDLLGLFLGVPAKLISIFLISHLEILLSKREKRIKKINMAYFYLMPIISVTLCASIFHLMLEKPVLNVKIILIVICCSGLLITNFLIFLLSFRIKNVYEYVSDMEIFQLKIEMKEKQYALLEEKDREYSSLLHDINHYLNVINHMDESVKDNIELVGRLKREINIVQKKMWCDRPSCNAILSDKSKQADELGIVFNCFVEPGFTIDQLSDFDLIGILSNLLDNALEAAYQAPEGKKWIHIKLFRVGENNQSVMRIENSYDFRNADNINFMKSTKIKNTRHGYGLKNVKEIVKRNDGILTIDKDAEKVSILVGLPG